MKKITAFVIVVAIFVGMYYIALRGIKAEEPTIIVNNPVDVYYIVDADLFYVKDSSNGTITWDVMNEDEFMDYYSEEYGVDPSIEDVNPYDTMIFGLTTLKHFMEIELSNH